jgi:hypothetical protein
MGFLDRFSPWYTCLGCGATANKNNGLHAVQVTRIGPGWAETKARCGTCGATWDGHQWETKEGERLQNPVLGLHG